MAVEGVDRGIRSREEGGFSVNPTLRWLVLFAVGLVIGFAGILLFLG
ncbi:MAG: hypothetical protein ACOYEF_00645 [Planifilum sp.]|jgi:hypothetical protein